MLLDANVATKREGKAQARSALVAELRKRKCEIFDCAIYPIDEWCEWAG